MVFRHCYYYYHNVLKKLFVRVDAVETKANGNEFLKIFLLSNLFFLFLSRLFQFSGKTRRNAIVIFEEGHV